MTPQSQRRLLTLPGAGVDPDQVLVSLLGGDLQHERSPLDQTLFGLAWAVRKRVAVTDEAREVLHRLVDELPARKP